MIRGRTQRRALIASILFLAAAGFAAAEGLEDIKQRGVLRMISFPHQESEFVRTNLEEGPSKAVGTAKDYIGVDVDVMAAFAETLGVELQIVRVSQPEYGALIPDLLEGRGDLIGSSLTITDARLEVVNFSIPYFSTYPAVVTMKESTVATVEELLTLRAATISGSAQEERLLKLGIPQDQLVHTNFTLDSFVAIEEGRADFTVADSDAAKKMIRRDPRFKEALRLPGEESYGYAIPMGSVELLEALNAFLEGEKESGRLEETIRNHF